MGEIYRLAQTVIAFLGEEDDVSKDVWDFAEATDQEYLWSPDLEVPEDVEAAVRIVLKRDWFSRIWVLQEVYQGQSGDFPRTLVMCSDRLLDWCDFASICESFELWYRPFVITMGKRLQTCLFEMLCRTRVSQATDPRDKFFAIIPLLADDEDLALVLTFSYSQTTKWIYTQIGLYLLRRYKLNVLSPVRYPHVRYPKLASWIPDWSQAHDTYLYKGQLRERREPECPFNSLTFQPCSRNSLNRSHEISPVLIVNGVQLDCIISNGKVLDFETSQHACMQFIQDFKRGPKACQGSVYMPTTFVQSTTVTQNFGNIFPSYSARDNLELCTHYVQKCRLFHDSFDQIGLAPAEIMPGNVVCAISGAFNICIFRPRPCGGYTLISGDCVTTRANWDHLELLRDGLLQDFIAKLGAEHVIVGSFELY